LSVVYHVTACVLNVRGVTHILSYIFKRSKASVRP